MIIKQWLYSTIAKLNELSVPTARLDAEVLLADLLGKDRSWLHAHPDYTLQRSDLCKLEEQVARRVDGEPIAYIIGKKEFYGRDFMVNKGVLVPRPESESFIELLMELNNDKSVPGFLHQVLDMGTGSGCLAVTVKLENPSLKVFATDISKKALTVAEQNARKHEVEIRFKVQSLLDGDEIRYDIILANLPYVPEDMKHISIQKEPREALYSGIDGLDHYRRLFNQLESKRVKIKYILTESLIKQHAEVENLATVTGYILKDTSGLVQLFMKLS